jgi:hypothetical protein
MSVFFNIFIGIGIDLLSVRIGDIFRSKGSQPYPSAKNEYLFMTAEG